MDFEKIYRTCYMKVYLYVISLCQNADLAEEITQETFVKALSGKDKFRGEAQVETWLCAIAKNLYADHCRKHKRDANLQEKVRIETGEKDDFRKKTEDAMDAMRVHEILHKMEEPYKEVFSLRVFGELSFAQIGQIFGKSESWCRVIFYRAKIKIRERMGGSET